MSNVKVVSYTITQEEISRDAAVEYINLELNDYTTRDVWLRGIELNDHNEYEGGGYLDDDEVDVEFIRCDDTGLYTVVFKDETNKQKLIEITTNIDKLEDLLSQAV